MPCKPPCLPSERLPVGQPSRRKPAEELLAEEVTLKYSMLQELQKVTNMIESSLRIQENQEELLQRLWGLVDRESRRGGNVFFSPGPTKDSDGSPAPQAHEQLGEGRPVLSGSPNNQLHSEAVQSGVAEVGNAASGARQSS